MPITFDYGKVRILECGNNSSWHLLFLSVVFCHWLWQGLVEKNPSLPMHTRVAPKITIAYLGLLEWTQACLDRWTPFSWSGSGKESRSCPKQLRTEPARASSCQPTAPVTCLLFITGEMCHEGGPRLWDETAHVPAHLLLFTEFSKPSLPHPLVFV